MEVTIWQSWFCHRGIFFKTSRKILNPLSPNIKIKNSHFLPYTFSLKVKVQAFYESAKPSMSSVCHFVILWHRWMAFVDWALPSLACGHRRISSSRWSLHPKSNGWREATTGNASVSAGYALRGSPVTSVNWNILNVIVQNSANLILNVTVDNRRLKCQTIREKNILVAFFYLHGQYHESPSREFSMRPTLHRW